MAKISPGAKRFKSRVAGLSHPSKRTYPNLHSSKSHFKGKNVSIYSILTYQAK